MGDRTFHIRQVWLSAIVIEIEISDMGSEMREKHGEMIEKQGEAREKVESAKKGKNTGWRKWEQVTGLEEQGVFSRSF